MLCHSWLVLGFAAAALAVGPEDPAQAAVAEVRAAYLEFRDLESAFEMAARAEAVRLREQNDELLYWMAISRYHDVPGFSQLPIDPIEALESLAERDPKAARLLAVIRLTERSVGDERELFERLGRDALAAEDAVALHTLADGVVHVVQTQRQWTGLEHVARSYSERALELGSQRSRFSLSWFRQHLDRDMEGAIELVREAAGAGDYRAAYHLAAHHAAGVLVPRSSEESLRWLEVAATRHYPPAIRELGFAAAAGAEPDLHRARRLFERAMELGDDAAALVVARGSLYGDFDYERDVERGLGILRNLAEQDHPRALCILGMIHYEGEFGLPADREQGERLVRRAAELGDELAMQWQRAADREPRRQPPR